MTYKKILISLIITFILNSCEQKNHILKFTKNITDSEILVPPDGCYRLKLIVNGELECESNLELFMNDKKTNFTDHLILNGNYRQKEIYSSDWYNDKLQLKFSSMKCIKKTFVVQVKFFD